MTLRSLPFYYYDLLFLKAKAALSAKKMFCAKDFFLLGFLKNDSVSFFSVRAQISFLYWSKIFENRGKNGYPAIFQTFDHFNTLPAFHAKIPRNCKRENVTIT